MKPIFALLFMTSIAVAQPMMIDPSKMSGIPRPDPQVPPGTITVRLIRGELANRMVGVLVGLADADGKIATQKTDDQGRATFSGLTGKPGPFQARASDGNEELTSQPIELQPNMGSRVMLVFQPTGGAADGVARGDKSLPAGTILVRTVGEGGEPRPGVAVRLGMMRQGDSEPKTVEGKTDDKGEAKFERMPATPEYGYVAEAIVDGVAIGSKPFKLKENIGSRVTIDARPVSRDVGKLKIAQGSHLIFQVTDDAVEVIELWNLENPDANAVDPGPNGLHLPLAEHAVSAQGGPQNPPNVTIGPHEVVVRGPIQPGMTQIQLVFMLAYDNATLDFVQKTPLPFEEIGAVTEKIDGMSIVGTNLDSEEREFQGRKLVLYRGPGTTAGGQIELHLRGLPHNDPSWRYLAAAIAIALILGFGLYAWRGGVSGSGNREKLESQREQLLKELAALEQADATDKRERKKQELTARLVRIYRELDELR